MSEFTRGQLKLAFRWHVAREITDADMEIAEGEIDWMIRTFPRQLLVDNGFVDGNGDITTDFEEALGESRVQLPRILSLDEKLALLGELFQVTLADDEFHHEEGNVLFRAATQLGVSSTELDDFLGTLDQVGDVELDDDLGEDDG